MKRLPSFLLTLMALALASCNGAAPSSSSSSPSKESSSSEETTSEVSSEPSSESVSSPEVPSSSEVPSSIESSSESTSEQPTSEPSSEITSEPSSEETSISESSEEPSSSEPSSSESLSSSEEKTSEEPSSEPSSEESSSSSKTSSSKFTPPANLGVADGPILHCFNWTLNNIKSKLSTIKEAGFRSVQISPMQPQKDPYSGNWKGEWWKLYQPLGFHVAVNNENVLGTKNELTSLCKAAKAEGIKVVMDVVANHLANGGNKGELNWNVSQHEPYIYEHQSETIHEYVDCNDNDVRNVVWGNIGMPDLNTANAKVQERVISLLKEYVDCGVDGFRFDAAKHIETPEDGSYASDFWPNVLGATTDYATKKGKDAPYYYGEILYTCGGRRSWENYTKRMSICDNDQGSAMLEAVVTKNLGALSQDYQTVNDGSKLVLWAESHDTYSNDDGSGYSLTKNFSEADMNKTYVVQTSRKGASSLYLSRPDGNIGSVGSTAFTADIVKAINNFHTLFVGKDESIVKTDGAFINVRGSGSECGAAIVGINSASQLNLTLNLADGKYINLVDGSRYTVSGGKVSVTLHNDCAILIPANASIDIPTGVGPDISFACDKPVFTDSTKVSITVQDADSATYTIDGKSAVSFSGSANVTVTSSSSSARIGVTVEATNEFGTSSKTYYVYKTNAAMLNSTIILINVPDTACPFIWAWPTNESGQWITPIRETGIAGFTFSDPNFLIANFPAGTSTPEWNKQTSQTSDMKVDKQILDYSSFIL